ncbi:unnamed protein product, partial [Rotaria sp. Silwood2]
LPYIPFDGEWDANAITVAGGKGPGSTFNRLYSPKGLYLTKSHTMFIADSMNHRILKIKQETIAGQIIAGKNLKGYASDLLSAPSTIIFDKASKSVLICDYHNRRVLQKCVGRRKTYTKTIIKNIECFGLALDEEGYLYVSDTERHEVRRYGLGDRFGTVVAGGNGQGRRLHQLNHPMYIAIGDDQCVYVSDSWNDRVMKWEKGATKGIIVAGGQRKGTDRNQLDYPTGVLVDRLDFVYVSDHWNNRVMRWRNGMLLGEILVGGNIPGNLPNQLNGPEGLAFDEDGNLWVADSNNHRIQRFNILKI